MISSTMRTTMPSMFEGNRRQYNDHYTSMIPSPPPASSFSVVAADARTDDSIGGRRAARCAAKMPISTIVLAALPTLLY
jgi:hypothetical protein